ncbi:hypothetical protein PUMCH_003037 [Australozyma saopauloensis]|uniref:Ribonuclease H n=1 Tax=Australozyma saopauloensis TaxID=291208 RepID=A0AAX4HBG5_9ASCO|nr:hypothetical protein PUMCH_003037 [[Candida] saopauloensis]
MGRLYYAVAKGNNPGVYESWDDCSQEVHGYSGARYKKFLSLSEAQLFINNEGNGSANRSSNSRGSSSYGGRSGYVRYSSSSSSQRDRSPVSRSYNRDSYRAEPSYESAALYGGSTLYGSATLYGRPSPQVTLASKLKRTKQIYVDGACRGNGKESMPMSGYGVWFGKDDESNAAVPLSDVDNLRITPSNQRAELYAMKHALLHVSNNSEKFKDTNIEICSDSKYSISCMEEWVDKWKDNNWRNSQNKPAANLDIILPTYDLYKKLNAENATQIKFVHVKGHLGIDGNEQADKLANLGADRMTKTQSRGP